MFEGILPAIRPDGTNPGKWTFFSASIYYPISDDNGPYKCIVSTEINLSFNRSYPQALG